jgi:hypothetical protein
MGDKQREQIQNIHLSAKSNQQNQDNPNDRRTITHIPENSTNLNGNTLLVTSPTISSYPVATFRSETQIRQPCRVFSFPGPPPRANTPVLPFKLELEPHLPSPPLDPDFDLRTPSPPEPESPILNLELDLPGLEQLPKSTLRDL